MARRCPVCRLALRADDPETWVQVRSGDMLALAGWPQGGYFVCQDCRDVAYPGRRSFESQPPPPDADPAQNPAWKFWCACCRRYAREDDPVGTADACMRVVQEDLDLHPELTPRPRPGALRMCRECWAVWGPVVRDRWERDGIIPNGVPLEALGTNVV